MEALPAALALVRSAKASLINAGIKLASMPMPAEHGLRLLQMVKQLDRIEGFMASDRGEEIAHQPARGKSRSSRRIRDKVRQGHVDPATALPPEPTPSVTSPLMDRPFPITRTGT